MTIEIATKYDEMIKREQGSLIALERLQEQIVASYSSGMLTESETANLSAFLLPLLELHYELEDSEQT